MARRYPHAISETEHYTRLANAVFATVLLLSRLSGEAHESDATPFALLTKRHSPESPSRRPGVFFIFRRSHKCPNDPKKLMSTFPVSTKPW